MREGSAPPDMRVTFLGYTNGPGWSRGAAFEFLNRDDCAVKVWDTVSYEIQVAGTVSEAPGLSGFGRQVNLVAPHEAKVLVAKVPV